MIKIVIKNEEKKTIMACKHHNNQKIEYCIRLTRVKLIRKTLKKFRNMIKHYLKTHSRFLDINHVSLNIFYFIVIHMDILFGIIHFPIPTVTFLAFFSFSVLAESLYCFLCVHRCGTIYWVTVDVMVWIPEEIAPSSEHSPVVNRS